MGPVPRDPDDPDLSDEWHDDPDDDLATPGFGWPVRLIALLILVAIVLLFVVAV